MSQLGHRIQAKRKSRGFTLLEMMIAIAIFAILSLSAFSVMRQMLLSDELVSEKTARLTAVNQMLLQMEQDFNHIVPKMARVGFGEERESILQVTSSRGEDNDAIWFTRNSWFNPEWMLSRSELVRVGYRLEEGNLIREYYTFVDRVSNAEPKKRLLLTGVSQLKFRFLSQNQWNSQWQNQNRLPDAVEVTISSDLDGTLIRQFKLMPSLTSQG